MTEIRTTPDWRGDIIVDFARSELFARTFHEGMELVEETAAYLDGAGRQEAKGLTLKSALTYATASMRLTTRLMQLASWLLVQRAVREGDLPPAAACEDRYRLAPEDAAIAAEAASTQDVPAGLADLLERSGRLYERVRHLDRRMYVEGSATERPHPVLSQHQRLKRVFGG
jgi:regulator of CtrA degradation